MNRNLNPKSLLRVLKREKLPEFKNITEVCRFVTKHMLNRYGLRNSSRINNGYCFVWAYLVWALWDNVEFVNTDHHVVVKHDGRFYDSESPCGCPSADDLFSSGGYEGYEEVDTGVYGMAWFWTKVGLYKEELRKVIFNTNRKLYRDLKDSFHDDYAYVTDIPEGT